MILVDTSVWIDHLRKGNPQLKSLLYENKVLVHPFIVGELACGSLRNRAEILRLLRALPEALLAQHHEVLSLIENERLYGRGIGWVDAHLLASALLSNSRFWAIDNRLSRVASFLHVSM